MIGNGGCNDEQGGIEPPVPHPDCRKGWAGLGCGVGWGGMAA